MMAQLKHTVCCQHFHMLIQNFTVNHHSSDGWYPKMWKFPHSRFVFVVAFDQCFTAQQTSIEFGWESQWDWYILDGCYDARLFITRIAAGSWCVMNGLWCFFPFVIEFSISFGKLSSNATAEYTFRYNAIWIIEFLKFDWKLSEIENEMMWLQFWGYVFRSKHSFIYLPKPVVPLTSLETETETDDDTVKCKLFVWLDSKRQIYWEINFNS